MVPQDSFYVGEYGFGLSASALQPMTDCPANAAFMEGYHAGQEGKPVKYQNVFWIFERYAGDASWRQTEIGIPGEVVSDAYIVLRFVGFMM